MELWSAPTASRISAFKVPVIDSAHGKDNDYYKANEAFQERCMPTFGYERKEAAQLLFKGRKQYMKKSIDSFTHRISNSVDDSPKARVVDVFDRQDRLSQYQARERVVRDGMCSQLSPKYFESVQFCTQLQKGVVQLPTLKKNAAATAEQKICRRSKSLQTKAQFSLPDELDIELIRNKRDNPIVRKQRHLRQTLNVTGSPASMGSDQRINAFIKALGEE